MCMQLTCTYYMLCNSDGSRITVANNNNRSRVRVYKYGKYEFFNLCPQLYFHFAVSGIAGFSTVTPSDNSDSESDGLSASAAAGIAVAITIVSLSVGVVIGLCVAWCMMRRGRGATSGGTKQKMEQLQGAIYEEPGPVDTAIPLSDNQAYGHVNMQRRN